MTRRTAPALRFAFDEEKATAAAAILLKRSGGKMPYLKLLKLLYLVERESLKSQGAPVIGDEYVSMKHGPVLSITYNLLKEEQAGGGTWRRHIRRVPQTFAVELIRDPGVGALSETEIEIIEGVSQRYGKRDQWALRDFTHKLPEWKDPGESCLKIHPEDILRAVEKSDKEIELIAREAAERERLDELFRGSSSPRAGGFR